MDKIFFETDTVIDEPHAYGDDMHARKYRVQRPVEVKKHWVDNDPFATAFYNSLSISFPYAEVFMIDCIKAWQDKLSPETQKEATIFIQQEANHSREHGAFNKGMTSAGYEIKTVEKDIINLVKRLNGKDDFYKLRATVCIEHLTSIISAEILSNDWHLGNADPELKKIWLWHATEEVEHKAVAFNVWNEATKNWSPVRRYLYRISFFMAMTYTFFRNRTVAQIHLLKQEGYSGWGAFWGMMRYGFKKKGLARNIIKPWFQFLKPSFHPWQTDDRHLIASGESEFMMDVKPVKQQKVAEPA